jgi:hypothetical protein
MKAKIFIVLAGIAMLAACKGSSTATTDSVSMDSVKLVKTADMRIKVKDVQTVGEKISKLTTECGGMVMHHSTQANIVNKQDLQLSHDSIKQLTVYNNTAELVIKLPTEFLEPFMDSLNHLGTYVDARKMDIEDHTIDYLATELKAENRHESVKLRSKIKLTQGGADSILALKDEAVNQKVDNLRTNDAVVYSTLTLNLYQSNTVHAEVVANDDLGAYKTPLTTRMGLALSNGWFYFSDLMVGVINLWVFILAATAIWYAVALYKHKKSVPKTIA